MNAARRGRGSPKFGRRVAIGAALSAALAAGLLASTTIYQEVGEKVVGPKRDKFDPWLKCAINELPKAYRKKLEACCKDIKKIAIHKVGSTGVNYKTNKPLVRHWRHGTPDGAPTVAFTPHATQAQLKKCEVCMALNLELFCKQIDCANDANNPEQAACKRYLKSVLRHESVHWTQYDRWPIWQIKNKDLFNYPHPEPGDPPPSMPWGLNGNDGGDESDEAYQADKKTRELIDKFDDLRSLLTELEAELAGNVRLGCVSKEEGAPYFDENGKIRYPGGKYYLENEICKLKDCKDKLFKLAAAAKALLAKPANKKLQDLAKRLCKAKKGMCDDIEAFKKMMEEAKKKWEKQ